MPENQHNKKPERPLTLEEMFGLVEGELSKEEASKLEKSLANDALNAGAVEAIDRDPASMLEKKKNAAKFKSTFEAELASIKQNNTPISRPAGVSSFYKYAAILLIFINIGVFSFYWMGAEQGAFIPYDISAEIERGASEPTKYEEAQQAYADGDYATAIELFNELPDDHEALERILFLKGNAYLANQQPAEAIQVFNTILNTKAWFLYRAEVQQAIGVAYLELGDN